MNWTKIEKSSKPFSLPSQATKQMSIKFSCPHCSSPLRIDERFAGRAGKCPSCAKKLNIPELSFSARNSNNGTSKTTRRGSSRSKSIETANSNLTESTANQLNVDKSEETSQKQNSPQVLDTPTSNKFSGDASDQQTFNDLRATDRAESTRSTHGQSNASTNDHQVSDARRVSQKLGDLFPENATGVAVPRWVVFTQGALLGTLAVTFFLFGLMVGSLTSKSSNVVDASEQVELSGSVFSVDDGSRVADMGAVVIVLPIDSSTTEKPNPKLLRPETYQAIDNPARKTIEDSGGQVVRVNSDGLFSAILEQNKKYQILVISKNANPSDGQTITKQMRAELGGFFLPLEDLLEGTAFEWRELTITAKPKQLDVFLFD